MTRQERWKYRLYHGDIRRSLFGKCCAKLPLVEKLVMFPNQTVWDATGAEIGVFTFRLFPRVWRGVRVKSSKHRMEVQCPKCLKFLPAGRLHQHIGTAACDREAHVTGSD